MSIFKHLKDWYSKINPATLTGAIDVIVVQQKDGSFLSSPFHVRFGKLGVLKAEEKLVDIEVNGESVPIYMKLDDTGAAYFVETLGGEECEREPIPPDLATSPIPEQDAWLRQMSQLASGRRSDGFGESEVQRPDTIEKTKKKKKKKKKKNRQQCSASAKFSANEGAVFHMDCGGFSTDQASANEAAAGRAQLQLPLANEHSSSGGAPAASEFHYFSEPEWSPLASPSESRPMTPVMSDSELEVNPKSNIKSKSKTEQSWEWGKFPSRTPTQPSLPAIQTSEALPESSQSGEEPCNEAPAGGWGLSYLWLGRRSKSTSGSRLSAAVAAEEDKQPVKEQPGIYLDDLQDADQEMLQIYVGRTTYDSSNVSHQRQHDEDGSESGNGSSLPISPHSVEGAICGPSSQTSLQVDMSLCGGLGSPSFCSLLFEQSKVTFDDYLLHLQRNQALFDNPDLVVRIGEQYYSWLEACPIIMSTVLYGRPLPGGLIKGTAQNDSSTLLRPAKAAKKKNSASSWWLFGTTVSSTADSSPSAAPGLEDAQLREQDCSLEAGMQARAEPQESQTEEEEEDEEEEDEEDEDRKVKPQADAEGSRAEEAGLSDLSPEPAAGSESRTEQCRKTLRLSSKVIQYLNLQPGMNQIQFSVTTAFQGTTRCSCHLYLWRWTDKVVISDIDGTITKSDVLGHVLPIVGNDWAQPGVASLFTRIVENGYHIAYLSARAIGQASLTKAYLSSVRQGETCLPEGPLFLNPTSLMNAFHREVIEKKPEVFKISCLKDIQSLFPENPFYAGYGNRINDVFSYLAVGVPPARIFTINYQGEIRQELNFTYQTSYEEQRHLVDYIFPPLSSSSSSSVPGDYSIRIKLDSPVGHMDYSSASYWKEPISPWVESDAAGENEVAELAKVQASGAVSSAPVVQSEDGGSTLTTSVTLAD